VELLCAIRVDGKGNECKWKNTNENEKSKREPNENNVCFGKKKTEILISRKFNHGLKLAKK
jgi:hypothetical protein